MTGGWVLEVVAEPVRLLPWLALTGFVFGMVFAPLPGRGPGLFARRDPWRGFRFAARRAVLDRAGGRCEGPGFVVWGRCQAAATEVDHIYPWSGGGPTVVSNGQALCRKHNRSKSSTRPPWWYVRALERRRATYFPGGVSPRVVGRMTTEDTRARAGKRRLGRS